MGPAVLIFDARYENEQIKRIKVHIGKDHDEADGFIMAARTAKALNPYSMITALIFIEAKEEE